MAILIFSPLANFGKHHLLVINYDFLGCWTAAPGSTTENCVTGSSSDDGRWTIQIVLVAQLLLDLFVKGLDQ